MALLLEGGGAPLPGEGSAGGRGDGGEGRGEASGRYLFLKPGLDTRVFEVGPEDRELAGAFHETARAVLDAWDAGAFFPRVVDPAGRDEPGRCKVCEVAEACVRGDSGARLRLFEWAERARNGAEVSPSEAALLQVWRLPAKPGNGETP